MSDLIYEPSENNFERIHLKIETKSLATQTEMFVEDAEVQTLTMEHKEISIQASPDSQTIGLQIGPDLKSVELQATPDPVLTQDCGIMVFPEYETVAIQVLPDYRSVQTQTK